MILTGVFMMTRVRTIFFPRNPYLFSDMTWGLMYVLHGLAGVGLIALVIVHVYFALRPEKLPITKSMIVGSMSRDFYLKEHDPKRWVVDGFIQPSAEHGQMATDFVERCDAIEECYEFMLAYAGQGLPSDAGQSVRRTGPRISAARRQRLTGLAESCSGAIAEAGLEPAAKYEAFIAVLDRDAQDSLAALELVLAQPAISSQLIDNLNASIHLRALLTDLFLVGEILRSQSKAVLNSAE